ncbi:hypothetical protein BJV82DRAFT_646382 [Fennellomyces sp. T-0311]|nr:hypothetical protein BJV82DRAFT_646382 [Fennellomyces sp. T-0311]
MQNRITKSCQARRNRRAERLRELLRLTPADSVLLDACKRKKVADVEALLSALSYVNPDTVRDNHLRTPLHIACARRDDLQEATAIARVLIRAGADVNNGVGDADGLQPMHMAVLTGNIQCVLMLLEEGGLTDDRIDSNAHQEYQDLQSITKVLVTHLANKHMTTFGLPSQDPNPLYHGLSDTLFAKEKKDSDLHLNQAINSITDQLSGICVQDKRESDPLLQDAVNVLMEKVRNLGLEETAVK